MQIVTEIGAVPLGPWRSRNNLDAFQWVVSCKTASINSSVMSYRCHNDHSAISPTPFTSDKLDNNRRRFRAHCAFWDVILAYCVYYGFDRLPH